MRRRSFDATIRTGRAMRRSDDTTFRALTPRVWALSPGTSMSSTLIPCVASTAASSCAAFCDRPASRRNFHIASSRSRMGNSPETRALAVRTSTRSSGVIEIDADATRTSAPRKSSRSTVSAEIISPASASNCARRSKSSSVSMSASPHSAASALTVTSTSLLCDCSSSWSRPVGASVSEPSPEPIGPSPSAALGAPIMSDDPAFVPREIFALSTWLFAPGIAGGSVSHPYCADRASLAR